MFQFDHQTQGVWGWGKDPLGLIKVLKLTVVSATCNPSTAGGSVGEGVGGWRKERQLGPYSETLAQKMRGGTHPRSAGQTLWVRDYRQF